MPVLMLGLRVPDKIWSIDLSSSLGDFSLSKLLSSVFEGSSFKHRCGIALCYSGQACCLVYYLFEINNGIHIYQFKFSTSWARESCVGNTGYLAVKTPSIILKRYLVLEFSIFCL